MTQPGWRACFACAGSNRCNTRGFVVKRHCMSSCERAQQCHTTDTFTQSRDTLPQANHLSMKPAEALATSRAVCFCCSVCASASGRPRPRSDETLMELLAAGEVRLIVECWGLIPFVSEEAAVGDACRLGCCCCCCCSCCWGLRTLVATPGRNDMLCKLLGDTYISPHPRAATRDTIRTDGEIKCPAQPLR